MPGYKPANEGIERKTAKKSWYTGTENRECSGWNRRKSAKNGSELAVLARFLRVF
jgi:hypothetical protein